MNLFKKIVSLGKKVFSKNESEPRKAGKQQGGARKKNSAAPRPKNAPANAARRPDDRRREGRRPRRESGKKGLDVQNVPAQNALPKRSRPLSAGRAFGVASRLRRARSFPRGSLRRQGHGLRVAHADSVEGSPDCPFWRGRNRHGADGHGQNGRRSRSRSSTSSANRSSSRACLC